MGTTASQVQYKPTKEAANLLWESFKARKGFHKVEEINGELFVYIANVNLLFLVPKSFMGEPITPIVTSCPGAVDICF